MSVTYSQLIYNIRNTPDKGKATRVKGYSDRQIGFWVNQAYGFLLTKYVEKFNSVPANILQDLGCWPLETVDQANCPSCWEWGDDVKVAKFPAILECKHNMGLSFFGYIDKRTRIYVPDSNYGSLDDFQRFPNKKDILSYMVGNDTVYIKGVGVEKLKTVNIQGLFKDPTEVKSFDECGNVRCFDKDVDPYPIPSDLELALYEIIFEKYITPVANARQDIKNDETNKALV